MLKRRQVIDNEFTLKVCAHLEEERRRSEELRSRLEKEREELRTKFRDATNEVRGQNTLANCVFLPDKRIYNISFNPCNLRSERSLCSQICRLESVMQQQHKNEKVGPVAASSCGPKCSRLEEELHQTRSRLTRIQEEAERQRDRQQKEIASLRADKHRLEEKVLEQSRLNTERSLLDQSQRHTEDRLR